MTSDTDKQPVVLAAGGTGGHLFPAEALAEALLSLGERVALVSDRRVERLRLGVLSDVECLTIRAGSPGGKLHRKLIGAAELGLGIFQARKLLRSLNPKAVVGFGGYPSFPTVFAASGLRIKTVIHEQNSVLGRANRLLAPRVTCIATSFPDTRMLTSRDQGKAVVTGNPVRGSVRALRAIPSPTMSDGGQMHLLVTGGSQGAHVFSEIVPAAIAALPASLRARLRIDQQCREPDLEATRAAYAQLGVSADVAPFFTDLPARLAGAHLVIARAGASTVSELAVAGRPAILVPLPTAMDNHQYFNANAFEEAGGGWVITQDGFTPESLSARLEAFMTAPSVLTKAAENARKLGQPEAAQKLAELVLENAAASGQWSAAGQKDSPGTPGHLSLATNHSEAAA